MFEVCVVGSGPAGVISAQTFIAQGYKVCLIDVGIESTETIAKRHFKQQLTEDATFFYPLEDEAYSAESGTQITKARAHLATHVKDYLKIASKNFSPVQTLAAGGLSAAWGAACFTYSEADLERASIGGLTSYYEAVAKLIGISGPKPSQFCAISNKQQTVKLDHNGQSLLEQRQATFTLEQPSLAMLTDPLEDRDPNPYFDMDFYSNFGNSVFRAELMLKTLGQHPNFTRIQGALVTAFKEIDSQIEISYHALSSKTVERIVAKKLVICAGALNSYRLVANSLGVFKQPNPILCNPYVQIPTIHLPNLGKKGAENRHSLSQLFGETANNPNVTLQFYSYRALLLSRLMEKTPMPTWFARLFWRSLVESLVIVGAHFADDGKSLRSIHAEPGQLLPQLIIDFPFPKIEGLLRLTANLCKLRCLPMGIIKPKMGASIHYAGTIPISPIGKHPIGMNSQGLIHGTQNVYVFDSSGWTYLPSRGLTFSIMANAMRLCAMVK